MRLDVTAQKVVVPTEYAREHDSNERLQFGTVSNAGDYNDEWEYFGLAELITLQNLSRPDTESVVGDENFGKPRHRHLWWCHPVKQIGSLISKVVGFYRNQWW